MKGDFQMKNNDFDSDFDSDIVGPTQEEIACAEREIAENEAYDQEQAEILSLESSSSCSQALAEQEEDYDQQVIIRRAEREIERDRLRRI